MNQSESVFDRCVADYFRQCKQRELIIPGIHIVQQPSRSSSDWVTKDVFVLRNCTGELARYKFTRDESDGFSVSRIK